MEMLRRGTCGLGCEDASDPSNCKGLIFGILAGRAELDEPLAGKSKLNRMELGDGTKDWYKKITFWKDGQDELLVKVFLESQENSG